MIEAEIDVLSRGYNLVGMMRVLNPFQFFPLYQVVLVRFSKLEPWISTCWGDILSRLSSKDWFKHKGGNFLWDTSPTAAETSLELLLESRMQ